MRLSVEGLDPAGKYFIFELADRIASEADVNDTPASVERFNSLPEHWRYIEPLVYYQNEVKNGGHHQYFWNSQGLYRDLVAQGLKYFQLEEFSQNYERALAIYNPKDYEVSQGATWEAFQEAYKEDRFDAQDSCFFKIKPDLANVLAERVRKNFENYK